MEFLKELLGDGNGWTLVISGIFGVLSLIFGAKWTKARKELKEFGKEFSEALQLTLDMPDKPNSAYLKKLKKEWGEVAKEAKDIIEIFKKKKDGQ